MRSLIKIFNNSDDYDYLSRPENIYMKYLFLSILYKNIAYKIKTIYTYNQNAQNVDIFALIILLV